MTKYTAKNILLELNDGTKVIPYTNKLDRDLGDITEDGDNKLITSRVYDPGMSIITDKKGYEELEKEKRSTFDRSKFEALKVGSPTITDDGEVSGFSASNYLRKSSTFSGSIDSFKLSLEVEFTSEAPSASVTHAVFSNGLDSSWAPKGLNIEHTYVKKISLKSLNNSGISSNTIIELNKRYLIELNYNSGNLVFKINGNLEYSGAFSTSGWDVGYSDIGVSYKEAQSSAGYALQGSIYLKDTFLDINGEEWISFNKTGIDQIKKDDYTKVGNPVISDDGIASGFSGNSYLKTSSLNISNATDFELYTPIFTLSPKDNNINQVLNWTQFLGTKFNVFNRANDANIECRVVHKDDGVGGTTILGKTFPVLYGVPLQVKFTYKNSIYSIFWRKVKEDAWILLDSVTSTQGVVVSGERPIGWENSVSYVVGSINLNAFKIYVDDQLVYQPTLRIPYTQSKTGNKIVDSVYRDRVQDMYEQFGYTHYYTIGDEPEKYNVDVVGSPTLSGGIASGFSAKNYIESPFDYTNGQNFELQVKVTLPQRPSSEGYEQILRKNISTSDTGIFLELRYSNEGNIVFLYKNASGTVQVKTCGNFNEDNIVNIKIRYNNRVIVTTDTDYIFDDAYFPTSSTNVFFSKNNYFTGTVDLSQFLTIVNGEVFRGYEPTIPNTFTMQTVENDAIIDFYNDGAGNAWEQHADLTCIQQGTGLSSGASVTLTKPFLDANYSLSCPYTTKTKTGFTTSQAGDYIAEGKITLN